MLNYVASEQLPLKKQQISDEYWSKLIFGRPILTEKKLLQILNIKSVNEIDYAVDRLTMPSFKPDSVVVSEVDTIETIKNSRQKDKEILKIFRMYDAEISKFILKLLIGYYKTKRSSSTKESDIEETTEIDDCIAMYNCPDDLKKQTITIKNGILKPSMCSVNMPDRVINGFIANNQLYSIEKIPHVKTLIEIDDAKNTLLKGSDVLLKTKGGGFKKVSYKTINEENFKYDNFLHVATNKITCEMYFAKYVDKQYKILIKYRAKSINKHTLDTFCMVDLLALVPSYLKLNNVTIQNLLILPEPALGKVYTIKYLYDGCDSLYYRGVVEIVENKKITFEFV